MGNRLSQPRSKRSAATAPQNIGNRNYPHIRRPGLTDPRVTCKTAMVAAARLKTDNNLLC